jgi:cell division protein WhiA
LDSGTIPSGWSRRCARLSSFASEVRRQLATGTASGRRRTDRAELAELVDAAGDWDARGVTFRTSSGAVARLVVRL